VDTSLMMDVSDSGSTSTGDVVMALSTLTLISVAEPPHSDNNSLRVPEQGTQQSAWPPPAAVVEHGCEPPLLKRALVVGISNYTRGGRMVQARNDATDIHAALRRMGYDARLVVDCDIDAFGAELRLFCHSEFMKDSTSAVFYFAGHGCEYRDTNWLMASQVPEFRDDIPRYSIDIQEQILKPLQRQKTRFNALILDCCRERNPLPERPAEDRGLGTSFGNGLEHPKGSLIAFACGPKERAMNQPEARNGLYTEQLLKHIETPELRLDDLFVRVNIAVAKTSRGAQNPYVNQSLRVEGASLMPSPPPEPS